MTEERLKNLIIEFCYKVVNEDMEDKRGYKEPAKPQTPVHTVTTSNNNTIQQNNFNNQVGTVIDVSRRDTSKGDPGIKITVELNNGKKANKFFTFSKNGKYYIYRDLLKPLDFEISKNDSVLEYQEFDYEQFKDESFIVETKKNEQGYLTIDKFICKVPELEPAW